MSTITKYNINDINSNNKNFNSIRSTIETNFYGNNVVNVNSVSEAYKLAYNSPGTIVTDMPVYRPEEIGLDFNTKVLLFNDGATTGRYAKAKVIIGESGISIKDYSSIARDAVYQSRYKKLYHAQCAIGLHEDFIVRAHLLIPENHENIMYSWLLNFQSLTQEYVKMCLNSKEYPEGDIYVFSDPDYVPESH